MLRAIHGAMVSAKAAVNSVTVAMRRADGARHQAKVAMAKSGG